MDAKRLDLCGYPELQPSGSGRFGDPHYLVDNFVDDLRNLGDPYHLVDGIVDDHFDLNDPCHLVDGSADELTGDIADVRLYNLLRRGRLKGI